MVHLGAKAEVARHPQGHGAHLQPRAHHLGNQRRERISGKHPKARREASSKAGLSRPRGRCDAIPCAQGKGLPGRLGKALERPGLSPAAEGEQGGGRDKGHQGLHPGIAPELGKLFRTEGRRGRDHDVGRGLKQAPLKRALKALHHGEHGEQGRHPKHEPSDAKHGQQGPAPAAAEGVKKAPAYPSAEGHGVAGPGNASARSCPPSRRRHRSRRAARDKSWVTTTSAVPCSSRRASIKSII